MITLSLLEAPESLVHLREDWTALLKASTSSSIFMTWEWAFAWWNNYGNGRRLGVLLVLDAAELVAIVPLYREEMSRFGLRYSAMHLIGDGSFDSDYLDAIVRTGAEPALVTALSEFLSDEARRPDVMFLNDVPEDSVVARCVRRVAQPLNWHWREEEVSCTSVALPDNWETYLKRLAPRMRTKVRSLERELRKNHDVRTESCENASDLPARLESLFDLHERRWRLKGRDGVFQSISKRRFYAQIADAFLANDALHLYSLVVDGAYVAHQFCLERNGTMFLLQEGFDPAWQDRGVGNVLRSHVFRDCIARGVTTYDFLAGVTAHKLSWGATIKKDLRIAVGRRYYKNAMFFGIPKAREAAKRVAKALVPERVIAWHRSHTT